MSLSTCCKYSMGSWLVVRRLLQLHRCRVLTSAFSLLLQNGRMQAQMETESADCQSCRLVSHPQAPSLSPIVAVTGAFLRSSSECRVYSIHVLEIRAFSFVHVQVCASLRKPSHKSSEGGAASSTKARQGVLGAERPKLVAPCHPRLRPSWPSHWPRPESERRQSQEGPLHPLSSLGPNGPGCQPDSWTLRSISLSLALSKRRGSGGVPPRESEVRNCEIESLSKVPRWTCDKGQNQEKTRGKIEAQTQPLRPRHTKAALRNKHMLNFNKKRKRKNFAPCRN